MLMLLNNNNEEDMFIIKVSKFLKCHESSLKKIDKVYKKSTNFSLQLLHKKVVHY